MKKIIALSLLGFSLGCECGRRVPTPRELTEIQKEFMVSAPVEIRAHMERCLSIGGVWQKCQELAHLAVNPRTRLSIDPFGAAIGIGVVRGQRGK